MRPRGLVACRAASCPSLSASAHAYAGNQTICRRYFGAYAPLCRRLAPTDARIKGLGKEIADEYALLRDSYSKRPPLVDAPSMQD
jgi:triacylglycerol lipase